MIQIDLGQEMGSAIGNCKPQASRRKETPPLPESCPVLFDTLK